LHDCTRRLPRESARLLDLRYQDGWDFTRIAAFLGRSVQAARQHLARIRIALRDCVQKRLAKA
jgi:DNA-directed RNA polymerase specialized sigma24 family protein